MGEIKKRMKESDRINQKPSNEKENIKYITTYLKWMNFIYIPGKKNNKKPFNLFGKSGKL